MLPIKQYVWTDICEARVLGAHLFSIATPFYVLTKIPKIVETNQIAKLPLIAYILWFDGLSL
jgi:hypothetical protein